ncbi:hypothetical protein J2S36_000952 [Arcanobacterium hippocoleae]|uniref:Transposase n=1 Tax=Arcanobacterium hippocoleae TaxID=149017 RepID=A0ABU1T290_9ACTO|nr:hypothetical protein [Arcanobacterium hippocoleae]
MRYHRLSEHGLPLSSASVDGGDLSKALKRIRELEMGNEVLRRAAAYLSQANLPQNDLPACT